MMRWPWSKPEPERAIERRRLLRHHHPPWRRRKPRARRRTRHRPRPWKPSQALSLARSPVRTCKGRTLHGKPSLRPSSRWWAAIWFDAGKAST